MALGLYTAATRHAGHCVFSSVGEIAQPSSLSAQYPVLPPCRSRNEVLSDALSRLTTDPDPSGLRMEYTSATLSEDEALGRERVFGGAGGGGIGSGGVGRHGSPVVPRLGKRHDLVVSLGGENGLLWFSARIWILMY